MSTTIYYGQEISVQYIPINNIISNPNQPRRIFEQSSMDEMVASISEYGVMQPLSIRYLKDNIYELISGERRLRAAKIVGLQSIPAIVLDINDKDSAIIALMENLQRQNINYIEEAQDYHNILKVYNITNAELAKKLGKLEACISNKLKFLRFSDKVREKLIKNNISENHAKELLKMPSERFQIEILDKVIMTNLTVKETENIVEEYIIKILNDESFNGEQKVKRIMKDIRLFINTIKNAVEIMNKSGVNTEYLLEEKDDFYEIKINISV